MGRPMTDAERAASIAKAIAEGRAEPMPPESELAQRRAWINDYAGGHGLKHGGVSLGGLAAAAAMSGATDVPDYVEMAKQDAASPPPPPETWKRPQRSAADLRAILDDARQGIPPFGSPAWEKLEAFRAAGDDVGVYGVQLRVQEMVPELERVLRAQEKRERRRARRAQQGSQKHERRMAATDEALRRLGGRLQYVAMTEREGSRVVIDFPDCEGCSSYAEADEVPAAVAHECLHGWLETTLQLRESPPRPSTVYDPARGDLLVTVDDALVRAIVRRWHHR